MWKRWIPYTCHTIWYYHTYKTIAVRKCTIIYSNNCFSTYLFRNNNVCFRSNIFLNPTFIRCAFYYPIFSAISIIITICRWFFCYVSCWLFLVICSFFLFACCWLFTWFRCSFFYWLWYCLRCSLFYNLFLYSNFTLILFLSNFCGDSCFTCFLPFHFSLTSYCCNFIWGTPLYFILVIL